IHAGEGEHLVKSVAEHFNVARSTANRALQTLVKENWLKKTNGTRPLYSLGENRQISKTYSLKDLEEDIVWSRDFKPIFNLPKNIYDIAQFGFTEILNNAIDHSEGDFVSVWMAVEDKQLRIIISDDGIGIFKKISEAMKLPDPRLSILELSKGKFTTDPKNHSGQGIFFTSRMFDRFQIESGDLVYDHDIVRENDYFYDVDHVNGGTLVFMRISTDSTRTSKEIFDEYTTDKEDYGFDKTVVPVRLAVFGNENL
ncbi:helix-turn-helix domain-containing protein, partial [Reticulomyxa filosa]